MSTTNTRDTFLGHEVDQYTADDHAGHKGHGRSPEEAQEALERAQEKDIEYAIGGNGRSWVIPDGIWDGRKIER